MHRTWTFLSEFRETLPDCASWSPLGAHILFSTVMNPAQMAEGRMKGPATAENVAHPNVFDSTVLQKMKEESERLRSGPSTALPCANVQPAEDTMICKDPGTMACSACKLVSYCSKECQTAHWKRHKRDCKNSMRSMDWIPNWVRESRSPSFITESEQKEETSAGISLWGTTPAIDVINLVCNENDPNKDFSLAFVASGDLRHVLHSFNGLPSDYSGHLNILVNDFSPVIFCRNIVLLLILGNVSDETMAADMALHFWYSIFMPSEYRFKLSTIILSFLQQLQNNTFPMPLGPRSTLLTFFRTEFLTTYFHRFISSSYSIRDIQDEYNRVRTAPSQQDYRDRMYAPLKPSHRIAFHQYRRLGIMLPFGAKSDHFDCPNLSLFSLEGKWLQSDHADPLEGWDIPTVIDTGKAHGAQPEDVYGCLYFFLSKQLRIFAGRLRTFSSSFTVLPVDARKLPNLINTNGLEEFKVPKAFDRIEVSNTLDTNYVGLHDALTLWGPLLEESQHATIIGYFMNWTTLQQAGRASGAGERVMESLTKQVMEKEKVNSKGVMNDSAEMQAILHAGLAEALYENSQPFFQFLQSQDLDNLLTKTGLGLRDKHHIVPHRILAPLQGSPTALPEFPDDDTWYYHTKLTSHAWSERYVEFERNSK